MEAYKQIPSMDVQGFTSGKVDPCGAGIFRQVVGETEKQDYLDYLEKLENDGFERTSGVAFVSGKYPYTNATYKKGNLLVCVTYSEYWHRTYIVSQPDLFKKDWTAKDVFEQVPQCDSKDAKHYGAGNYVIEKSGTKSEYLDYLKTVEEAGFTKYADNGNGLNKTVFHAVYEKNTLVLTITYIETIEKIYVSATYDLPLSKHLLFDETATNNLPKDAKTELHMMEMWFFGNSFLIRLKNGNFIICDGGTDHEIRYLIDYMESLCPNGTKPVVEAWLISHAHRDHTGVLRMIVEEDNSLAERILVNGIYFNEPNDDVLNLDSATRGDLAMIHEVTGYLKTEDGNKTQIYRPQTGQRYYFCDLTVDILLGQEQLPTEQYSGDLNDSSTWYLFNIEGQKVLIGGDGEIGGMRKIMEIYDRDFMKLDMFSVLHHTLNTWDEFTDYCTVQTVLGTKRGEPEHNKAANEHLKEVTNEWLRTDDGTKVLTFPYQAGTAKCQTPFEWIYHKDRERYW